MKLRAASFAAICGCGAILLLTVCLAQPQSQLRSGVSAKATTLTNLLTQTPRAHTTHSTAAHRAGLHRLGRRMPGFAGIPGWKSKGRGLDRIAPRSTMGVGGGEGVNDKNIKLHIYNIDKYGLSKLGSKALKKEFNAIWHVAISAYGNEYWFDHQINEASLDGIKMRINYEPTEIIDLGPTEKSLDQFRDHLVDLQNIYNIETYDCFKWNCHNFAEEVAQYLTGNSIPRWCLEHGGEALSNLPEKDAETIRWASNKIAKIMMVSWGRYNKERFEKVESSAE